VGVLAAGASYPAPARALWARIDLWLRRPRSVQNILIWLGIYLALAANWPLWNELARIGGAPSTYLPTIAAMAVLMVCATVALLSFTAWSRWMKPLWFAVVLLAAFVQHYMLEYRVVMDPTMVANVLQTDPNEARDLMSWRMAYHVLLVVLLPALALWRIRIVPMRFVSKLWRNAALLLLAVAVALVAAVSMNRQLAPLMRNNVHLRYMMNPVASLYSAGAVVFRPMFKRSRKLIPITAGTSRAYGEGWLSRKLLDAVHIFNCRALQREEGLRSLAPLEPLRIGCSTAVTGGLGESQVGWIGVI